MSKLVGTLRGQGSQIPPLWLMRQAGRYLPEYQSVRQKVPTFMELCFHEGFATEVTLQPLRRFDFDAAILFCDILVIPHVLGQKVYFIQGHGPILEAMGEEIFFRKAREVNIIESLNIPLKVLQNVRKALPLSKAVIGFAGSPWTIATYMLEQGKSRSFSRITGLLQAQSPVFKKLMALLEEAVGTFLLAQIEAGADVVQIFDSWARAVPPPYQKEWIVGPTRRLVARIHQRYPDTPVIYYGRGASHLYPQIAKGLENMAFGVDEGVSLKIMKEKLQPLAPVQGNLSPEILVEGGERLKNHVTELLKAFQGTPFVFNLGHGILPQTPISHVEYLLKMVREG